MTQVLIAGTGMTPFGKFPGRGIRSLATAAIDQALADAGIPPADVARVYFGNAVAGIVSHQEMIRGQVALRHHPLARAQIYNVENACASGGSALNLAYEAITGGRAEVVIAVGVEQLNHEDRSRPFNALRGSTDIEEIGEGVAGQVASNSVLMDFYAAEARAYLERPGTDVSDFARVAEKNRFHAVRNPLAHFRKPQTIEEVLAARTIVSPLTLPMCSPTTDGAAAIVLCSPAYARRLKGPLLEVAASHLASGRGRGSSPVADACKGAYAAAGVAPRDLSLVELHDAAAPAELFQYVEIGLCREGQAHELLKSGDTRVGGRIPVNVSGGLLSRGHPLGATGCAQVVELADQLRGRCDGRQVDGARVALAVNGGGWLDGTYALAVATIIKKYDVLRRAA